MKKMRVSELTYFLQIISLFHFNLCFANQAQLAQFTKFKCDKVVVCAIDKAPLSFAAQSQGQCVVECQRQRVQPSSCVGVNYREQLGVCEMFFTSATNFLRNIAGCQYLQKGAIDTSLSRLTCDPCLANNGGCSLEATCTNTPTDFTCSCKFGFNGDGFICTDINECSTNNGGCSANAVCTNIPGSFTCACVSGYDGNGFSCSDINECLTNSGGCSSNGVCTNIPGSFTCACVSGYDGNGFSCSEINECLTNNGGCSTNAVCSNIPGTFTCACVSGYSGNGFSCSDINECLANNGDCSANGVCTNIPGSFTCACVSGYAGNGFSCSDIIECLTDNGDCSANAVCTNIPGSFTCACVSGYSGNGFSCSVRVCVPDINECLPDYGIANCSPGAYCTNTPGSFTCACLYGYTGDGFFCVDIDECLTNNGGCGSKTCTNTQSSFTCTCPSRLTGNGYQCSSSCVQSNLRSLTAASGTLCSMNYPNAYINGANCQWLITASSPYTVVSLSFSDFYTEQNYDFVNVYDGSSTSSTLLMSSSDCIIPDTVKTTQRYMFISFTSDSSVIYYGFSATYTLK